SVIDRDVLRSVVCHPPRDQQRAVIERRNINGCVAISRLYRPEPLPSAAITKPNVVVLRLSLTVTAVQGDRHGGSRGCHGWKELPTTARYRGMSRIHDSLRRLGQMKPEALKPGYASSASDCWGMSVADQ